MMRLGAETQLREHAVVRCTARCDCDGCRACPPRPIFETPDAANLATLPVAACLVLFTLVAARGGMRMRRTDALKRS